MSKFKKYAAPDGGYGWVIVIGMAINNILTIPIVQGFGMIYGNTLKQAGITMTQSTLIININQAFGTILGIINGPLLRTFGYRKIAIFGALLYSFGILLTSFGSNLIHVIVSYGMIASLGMSMNMSASMLALNTYFREKKGRATGWAMTFTGLGPIVIPQLISFLLPLYQGQGTMFILGGLSLNSLVGSLLYQPIKWHAKPVKETPEDMIANDDFDVQESASLIGGSVDKNLNEVECESKRRSRKISRTLSAIDYNDDNVSVYGFEMPVSMINGSLLDLREDVNTNNVNTINEDSKKMQRKSSVNNMEFEYKRSNSFNEAKARKFSISSTKYSELGLSRKVLAECPEEDCDHSKASDDEKPENAGIKSQEATPSIPESQEKREPKAPIAESTKPIGNFLSSLLRRISLMFGLELLRDPIYVNVMLGMSVAIFAEFNFSVLMPFILADMKLNTEGVAVMMSTLASSDLVLRALAPYIGEWLHKPPRIMYLVSLVLLILARTALLFVNTYAMVLVVSFCLGIAKGVRTVYMTLVIPSYVPLEKLVSASSIQSMVNGFFLISAGPFLGLIRDKTGSFEYCIVFINFATFITIVMWLSEFAALRIMKRGKKSDFEMSEKELTKIESQ